MCGLRGLRPSILLISLNRKGVAKCAWVKPKLIAFTLPRGPAKLKGPGYSPHTLIKMPQPGPEGEWHYSRVTTEGNRDNPARIVGVKIINNTPYFRPYAGECDSFLSLRAQAAEPVDRH